MEDMTPTDWEAYLAESQEERDFWDDWNNQEDYSFVSHDAPF